jgi:hypothetical protein
MQPQTVCTKKIRRSDKMCASLFIRKVYFRMVYKTKKTFEIYEILSIRNVVNTLLAAVKG